MSEKIDFVPYAKIFRSQYCGIFQTVLSVAEQTAEIQQKLNECFAILKRIDETINLFECETIKDREQKK